MSKWASSLATHTNFNPQTATNIMNSNDLDIGHSLFDIGYF